LPALRDDFGRTVLTTSPDSGITLRSFDAADRLIAMRDALGNEAQYEHDAAGRIVRQSVKSTNAEPVVTQWRYQGRHLVELIHPTQSERYTYDANGWRTRRRVVQGNLEATARYTFDAQGQLAATTLPDGSRIGYERNGQGQVTAISRSRVHTEWLRRFEQPQLIASSFERDIVGLKAYTAGNGIQARFIRSREGTLARVVYRQPQPKVVTAQGGVPEFIGRNTQDFFERFMGIAPAQAAEPAPVQAEPVEALGAVRDPIDAQALIDHRYLWDARGNLLLDAQRAGVALDSAYAYDWANRLIIASTQAATADALRPVAQKSEAASQTSFYLHDAQGRRVLALQDGATRRIDYDAGSHRWRKDADAQATYDASGLPTTIGQRAFDWDAHGRLLQVREGKQAVANYTYSHRGERIAKAASAQTHYLYDDASQLQAELDASGAITRQYVYAADLPIAVIDGPAPLHQDANAWLQAWRDVQHLLRSWIGKEDTITWLHTNHLGAPEAATDARGQLLWQATYAPSGRAKTTGSFALNLRLPGQYADTETGLHYNLNRCYDPERGQYLSPDPFANAPGYPDGPNPYAYVRYNPLRYVDPLGLILIAFDGTGNTNNAGDLAELGNGLSNVWQFHELYNDGNRRYVTGVGTRHRETDPQFGGDIFLNWGNTSTTDLGGNFTGPQRIERMIAYFNAEAELFAEDSRLMDIDIIGFSRGAAQARDFANRINANTRNGQYRYTITVDGQTVQRCQMINFRFMGLWDTVLSTNLSGRGYNMNIVPGFQYVAQAVALNEYRGNTLRRLPNSTGAFPLESIMRGAMPVGQERIERGFIGAHADIGGGFAGQTDALPLVALNWMVEQARNAGVRMLDPRAGIPASPVIHDKSDNQYCTGGPGCSEDRQVRGGSRGTQRQMTGTGMTYADTAQFIRYYPADINGDGTQTRAPRADQSTGSVDMARYLQWLRDNGYELGNLQVQ
jgi:RHS repeat-associated protein